MRCLLVLFVCLGLAGPAWAAPSPLLEGIQYFTEGGEVSIEIRFSDSV